METMIRATLGQREYGGTVVLPINGGEPAAREAIAQELARHGGVGKICHVALDQAPPGLPLRLVMQL